MADIAGSTVDTSPNDAELQAIGDVPASYRHHDRAVRPGQLLKVPDGFLKWYEVHRADAEIPSNLWDGARRFALDEAERGNITLPYGLGFVVAHLSWPIVFLIVGRWQSHQEMWTRLYTRDLEHDGGFVLDLTQGTRPTCCVWEMAPMWHERDAWVRYLYSARDTAAKRAFLADQLSGEV